jgi:hypothetical protein
LTGMVTSVPPYEIFSLIKNNILHQFKNYKNHFENSNFWGMWPLDHVGHVTYSFINMLFISTMKNIVFNKTENFVGRNTSDHACQIFCSKSNCETMYHWFYLLEITVVKIMNNHTYIQSMLNLMRFISFLLYQSLPEHYNMSFLAFYQKL